jgi:RNA polymerase sigma-70 factor (ECF subfamily)
MSHRRGATTFRESSSAVRDTIPGRLPRLVKDLPPNRRPEKVRSTFDATVVHLPVADGDAALVEALRDGDPAAGAALFDRYGPHVRRVLLRVLGIDLEIGDVLHEVFVVALESIEKLERGRALRPWLTSIAVHLARGLIRKRVRRRILFFISPFKLDESTAPTASHEAREGVAAMYEVLGAMPADLRIAFALRFVDGMDVYEVASACGVSRATVTRRLARAQAIFLDRARSHPSLVEWLQEGTRWTA